MAIILDHPGGSDAITRALITRTQSQRRYKEKNKVREESRCDAAGFEGGGRGHRLRNAGNL